MRANLIGAALVAVAATVSLTACSPSEGAGRDAATSAAAAPSTIATIPAPSPFTPAEDRALAELRESMVTLSNQRIQCESAAASPARDECLARSASLRAAADESVQRAVTEARAAGHTAYADEVQRVWAGAR